MHYPHVTLRQAGLQALPVAQASSQRGGILATAGRCWPWPLVRKHEPGATIRLRAGVACMPDRLDDRHEHIQHPRDQDRERYATRRIVGTAGAAAWLPHSKLRDTRMMSGYRQSIQHVPARLERRTTGLLHASTSDHPRLRTC
ncbi:MAG: hypothetical protein KatS3mg056_3777 [Chloroflexus sp.]|nr:MAG: hypothetical protein KatS3mg056_3777 [Chloroflexus sp.]